MQKLFGIPSDDADQSGGSDAFRVIDALYDLEMKSNILALRQERQRARFHKSMAQ